MRRETTIVEKDLYWYRLVAQDAKNFIYTWGWDLEGIWRAELRYLGRGKYSLANRTLNGEPKPYGKRQNITINARKGKRTHAYEITLRMIERLL